MFVTKPIAQRVKEGEAALFKALVDGYPMPSISWLLNGKQLKEEDAQIQFNATSGEAILSIRNVVLKKHAGSITCRLENPHGDQKETVQFDVLTVPVITMQLPKQKEVVSGRDIKLALIAQGSPRPTAEWFFKGRSIGSTNVPVNNTNDEYQLLIKQATVAQNEGSYEVVLQNEVGKVQSTGCVLTVLEPVKLTRVKPASDDVHLKVGEAFEIVIDVSGKETPQVQLTKDENVVQFTSKGTARYTFSVASVKQEHQGVYKVIAKNKASTQEMIITLGEFVCILQSNAIAYTASVHFYAMNIS